MKQMEQCLLDLVKNEVQSLMNLVKNEAQYLCCFNSFVENFEQERKRLAPKHIDMNKKINKARGVFSFKSEALDWKHEADDIINIDTTAKKKCFFDLCPNCWWQYWRGKELAKKTECTKVLLGRSNTNIIAGKAYLPIKEYFFPSQEFVHFKSRELEFQDLRKALEDGNCNIVGLQGMGGTGKTYMAKKVGSELEGSRFDEVFLLEVSILPDFNKLRRKFVEYLRLPLEEWKEEEYSMIIWITLLDMKKKLLIILDDVWEAFDLKRHLGIPCSHHQHKGCSVLITTRKERVCVKMECQIIIKLETLNDKDALDLFQKHVGNINDSSRGLKGVPEKIVKHCGGVPIAIAAIAEALKGQPTSVWKDALKSLKDCLGDQNLTKAYKCLDLSYCNLKNEKAKVLFLISSLFPKGFEVPEQLLSKIGIGLGSSGDNNKYHATRIEVLAAIMELKDSTLLFNSGGKFVMHDLIYDVALQIREKDFQMIVNSNMVIKDNIRYLFWKNSYFPGEFDGKELELLSIFLDDSKDLKVSNAFFMEMTRLKVLILVSTCDYRISALSLLHSLRSLANIQTLTLMKLKLGDISMLENLSSLVTLSLHHCSFIKLPEEFPKLKKLGLLELEMCEIEMNNPFEVIEKCSQLEELAFVGNKCGKEEKDAISQNESSLSLHRYQISNGSLSKYHNKHGSVSKCFRLDDSRHLISEATFKRLVGETELLILEGRYEESRWKNLIPSIIPVDNQGMNELMILYSSSCPDIECLVDTKNHSFHVIAFPNLVELHLYKMDVEELYQGPMPYGFLEQLNIMKLKDCQKLKGVLFNGNFNLCYLQSLELEDCPMLTSIFQQSTTQTLKQLGELRIKNCKALQYIMTYESLGGEIVDDGDNDQESYGSLFPKLKTLQITGCDQLEIILPILFAEGLPSLEEISVCECEQLKFIFYKFVGEDHDMLPSLEEMELSVVPSLMGIYKEYQQPITSPMQKPPSPLAKDNSKQILQRFRFLNSSRTTNEDKLLDHTIQQGLSASKKWINAVDILKSLNVHHIRKLKIVDLTLKSASLLTLSMASMIMWEELTIGKCIGLKHLISSKAYDNKDQINTSFIFPKLEMLEIWECKDLKFLFPSTTPVGIKNLKSLTIKGAPELKYVFGKYQHDDHLLNQNSEVMRYFDLPALKFLYFKDAPKMISICFMDFIVVLPSHVILENCGIESVTKLMVCSDEEHLNQEATKEIHPSIYGFPLYQEVQNLTAGTLTNIKKMELENCSELTSVLTLPVASTILLKTLTIKRCRQLKCIVVDEGDAQVSTNRCSIFPKLKNLEVSDCEELEFLFPATLSVELENLESLTVTDAFELKYVIGKHQQEGYLSNQNQNVEFHFDLPVLQSLCLRGVPNLVSLCPENYCLRGLPRGFIELEIPRTIRSFTDFLVCVSARQQSSKTIEVIEMHLHDLESLVIKNSRIEEIFNLMNLNVKKIERGIEPWALSLRSLWLEGLSELRNICVDPKHILRLNNLSCLKIIGCRKLEVVFSASTLRILPKLEELTISECGELVQIIEEENEESARDHLRHEPYFPKLSELTVEGCHRLKYLFSLTVSGILPKPHELCVRDASTLEHVLIRPDEPKEMAMEDVLPNLRRVTLKRNQSLISICHGIDFQTLEESSEVDDCPKFSFHETTANQLQVGPTNLDFERKAEAEKTLSSLLSTNQSYMGETKGRPNLETQQSPLSSPTFSRGAKEGTKEIVEEDVISEITDTHNASLKDNLVCKEEQNGKFMIDPQQPTNGEPYLAKTSKEVRLTTILGGPDSKKIETRNQLTDSKIAEERVEEGDSSETLHPSYLKKVSIPTSSNLTNLPVGDITGTTITILEEEEQGEEEGDPSMPLASNISREQTSEATSPKQIPLSIVSESSYGKNIHDNVGTSNQRSHEALDAIEVSSKHAVKHESAEINVPSFNETSNASSVHGLQEIVDTMKLDSVEASILAEAFETHPQLRLSKEDRSTQLLCDSYRVLLDILNILATRTPFTITKEDKKSLVENLKDALVLGFDREWLESVKNNVFNCDVSEVRHMQEVLKSFEDKLETNKTELALVCDQEDEAARRVEVAQKELEAVRARHYQLSKERQDLQNQRDQCRETFAAKFRSFGF